MRISTHSLTRRLTDASAIVGMNPYNFNSQPHKEADETAGRINLSNLVFQLTASQGG